MKNEKMTKKEIRIFDDYSKKLSLQRLYSVYNHIKTLNQDQHNKYIYKIGLSTNLIEMVESGLFAFELFVAKYGKKSFKKYNALDK